jgi:hypothetical protein
MTVSADNSLRTVEIFMKLDNILVFVEAAED